MSTELDTATNRITEVVMFENWLRFYFIAEEGGKLLLRLPEKAMEQLKKRYASFYELAERLNDVEIDHNTSLKEVCLFVAGGFDGHPLPEDVISRVFESPRFQLELQLFSHWVQAHEEQLDAGFAEFADWQRMFNEWKSSDEVKEHRQRLMESLTLSGTDVPGTMQ